MNPRLGYFEDIHEKNNVYSFLEKHVQEFPNRSILKWSTRADVEACAKNPGSPLNFSELSVAQLYGAVNKAAFGLSQLGIGKGCLLYTSPSPRDRQKSRMPSSA